MQGTAASGQASIDQITRLRSGLGSRYTIERELGRGGMGSVYLAHDQKHDRAVAIKVLRPELAAALGMERFLYEIQTVARLTHPHILPLHDSGEAEGLLYYVMPYVEGEALRTRLEREKQLPLEDALQIAREVAEALSYAHSHNVLHRDIRPENILLESGHAVVADFGIARAITAAGGRRLTPTGIAVGSPAYMSPEQAAADEELDGRSDLYSLACVVYEMLAGQPPFTGRTPESVVLQQWGAAVPNLTLLRPAVPEWVAAAITRALAKAPGDRFRTAAAFAEALGKREAATLSTPFPQSRRPGLRSLAAVVAIVGGVLVLRLGRESSIPGRLPYQRTAIAVLPFENLSAAGPDAYFSGGLHDEVLTQLSKVEALKVISRTSVMGYAGTKTPLRQIASELQVGSVVEGSVQVAGRRLRIHVELIDAATDAPLWAEGYDRTLDDAFAIQTDVAQQIVAAVGATLSRTEATAIAAAPTQNAEAYRLYLQGQVYSSRPGNLRQDFETAEQLFERAVAQDSTFALAYASLSLVHWSLYWQRYDPDPRRRERARSAAETAIRLSPELPQAHLAMGYVYVAAGDFARALREVMAAAGALKGSAEARTYVGFAHRRLGQWQEALADFEQASALDPRNAGLFWERAFTLSILHRYEEAIAADTRALELAPDLAAANMGRAVYYYLWRGELDSLRAQLARGPQDYGVDGSARGGWASLALQERRPDSVLALLGPAGAGVSEGQYGYMPNSYPVALAQRLRGDEPAARAALLRTVRVLDSTLRRLPDDWRLHVSRSVALAALGRGAEATREAEWVTHSPQYGHAIVRLLSSEARAIMFAQLGLAQEAVAELEPLLAGPSLTSAPQIRLDPEYDPIRQDPRFQALLAKYAVPQPVR